MARRFVTSLITLALVLLLPTVLNAQQNFLFRVEVPFNFIAGGTHVPAGEYLVFHATPTLLQIIEKDGHAAAYIPVTPSAMASGDERNVLTFNRYGDTYFLAQVSTSHDRQVHQCDRCRAEKILSAESPRQRVTVAAISR